MQTAEPRFYWPKFMAVYTEVYGVITCFYRGIQLWIGESCTQGVTCHSFAARECRQKQYQYVFWLYVRPFIRPDRSNNYDVL